MNTLKQLAWIVLFGLKEIAIVLITAFAAAMVIVFIPGIAACIVGVILFLMMGFSSYEEWKWKDTMKKNQLEYNRRWHPDEPT